MSIPTSKVESNSRFVFDPALPEGHRHSLEPQVRPEKPSVWRDALRRERVKVWRGLSQFGTTRNVPKKTKEIAGIPETTNEHSALQQKYGTCWKSIGHGAYGTVSIFRKDTQQGSDTKLVAIKEFHQRPGQSSTSYGNRVLGEFCLASNLQHPNVIRVLDLFQSEELKYYQVMEYCEAGDLLSLMQSVSLLKVGEANCFFKQLMCGVQHLHESGIAHCDLKPENLLLTREGNLKISDFGCSQSLHPSDGGDEVRLLSGVRGSMPFVAPEEFTDDFFDGRAADVWACGVIYMLLRFGRHIWKAARMEDEYYVTYVEDRRVEEGFAPVESLEPVECRNVVYCLLDPKPDRRLTASQFLRSEWAHTIRMCNAGGGVGTGQLEA